MVMGYKTTQRYFRRDLPVNASKGTEPGSHACPVLNGVFWFSTVIMYQTHMVVITMAS